MGQKKTALTQWQKRVRRELLFLIRCFFNELTTVKPMPHADKSWVTVNMPKPVSYVVWEDDEESGLDEALADVPTDDLYQWLMSRKEE